MRPALRITFVIALVSGCLWAQRNGTGGGAGTNGPTSGPTPSPPVQQPQTNTIPTQPQRPPVTVSGQVFTADGSILPPGVDIQLVCNGAAKTVSTASPNGTFTAIVGGGSPSGMMGDASEGGTGLMEIAGLSNASGTGAATNPSALSGNSNFSNCDLQAKAPGYVSDRVSYAGRGGGQYMRLVLHRVSGDEGALVSALSLKAPKDAKKYFDNGTALLRRQKYAEAVESFRKAVTAYPQYADAWLALGRAQRRAGHQDESIESFRKAMELDPKFADPWVELGLDAASRSQWQEAAHYLDRAVALDPVGSPISWYTDSIANYSIGKFDEAERSIRKEMTLDTQHANPRAPYVLGMILAAKKDFPGAAANLRQYIAFSPTASDIEIVLKQAADLEAISVSQ